MTRTGERGFRQDAIRWLAVVLVAAGVAFVVTYAQSTNESSNGIPSAPSIRLNERATVSLATVTVQPVLSGEGRVIPGTDDGTWVIEAPVTPADQAYGLLGDPVGVKARILGGPSGFDCSWLGLDVGTDGSVVMLCQIPAEIPVVEGLTATMVLQLAEPMEVTALPLTAVLGSEAQGQVVVVLADGSTEVRGVELGASDTFNVEIVFGLSPDDTVLAAPIQRDFTSTAQ